MTTIQPTKSGLALGILLGGLHLVWSVLVLLGWAQILVNFSMWAHMFQMPVTVGVFDLTAALTVIVIATGVGYGIGFVFASIWNKVHK